MILKRISILNYKNLEQAELEFSPKMNCFIGQKRYGEDKFAGCGLLSFFL